MHHKRLRKHGDPLLGEAIRRNPVCTVEGCAKPHEAHGYCDAHYKKFCIYGDPLGHHTPKVQEFLQTVVLPYRGDECLIWPFARDKDGYAKMGSDGGTPYVCRIVCKAVNGPAPSHKHHAAHSCGNGDLGCVTGRHLRWATAKENMADAIDHGRTTRGERQPTAKLTETDVRAIRALKGVLLGTEIAKRFGVTPSTVNSIHMRRSWAWLD